MHSVLHCPAVNWLIVRLHDGAQKFLKGRELGQLDLSLLEALQYKGLVFTCRTTDQHAQFCTRLVECKAAHSDAVSCVLQTALGPYWASEFHRPDLCCEHIGEGDCAVLLRADRERVSVGGHGTVLFSGELLLPATHAQQVLGILQ
eukprot:TRINITY_DN3587_c0_g1_i4.p1 TRINITY_DN3587_c0_g1~~TRINITY_DN3587_c0_g1_i4.p1  ORF type:complete len:146 (-),score=42.20 TRINITY_DN3587_c0_g1_i4:202-639(-)